MDNKSFIDYIKGHGHININDDKLKKDLEVCANANIELVNYYNKLVPSIAKPEWAIEILSLTVKNNLTLKETEMFLEYLYFVKRITGFVLFKEKEGLLDNTNNLLAKLNNVWDKQERKKILTRYTLDNREERIRVSGMCLEIERIKDRHLVNLYDTFKGKSFKDIECVCLTRGERDNVNGIFMNHEKYQEYKRFNHYKPINYFEVLFYDK